MYVYRRLREERPSGSKMQLDDAYIRMQSKPMVGKVKYYKNREQCVLDFTEISEEKGGRGVCFTCSLVQLITWACGPSASCAVLLSSAARVRWDMDQQKCCVRGDTCTKEGHP